MFSPRSPRIATDPIAYFGSCLEDAQGCAHYEANLGRKQTLAILH